jgi:hypothetical protein
MNTIKVYKHNTSNDLFELYDNFLIKTAKYNQVISEIGQIDLVVSKKDDKNIEVENKIDLFSNGEKIKTAYITEITENESTYNIIALTEEYLLARVILPSHYTSNIQGLKLKNIAEVLTRNYWQRRWSDRFHFEDTTNIQVTSEIRISDRGFTTTTANALITEHFLSYECVFYSRENGIYQDRNIYSAEYDRVAILDLHSEYLETTEVADLAKVNKLEKFTLDEFNTYSFGIKTVISSLQAEDKVTLENGVFTPDKGIIVGMEILNLRGRKIKIYLNSQATNFNLYENQLLSNRFLNELGPPGVPKRGTVVYTKGSKVYQFSFGNVRGFFNMSTGVMAGSILERVRWAEKYKDVSSEEYIERSRSRNNVTGVFYFGNTSGTRTESVFTDMLNKSSSLYDEGEKSPIWLSNLYPNEFTEKTGALLRGNNTTNQDFYFVFKIDGRDLLVDDYSSENAEFRFKVPQNLLETNYLRAVDFIFYKQHLTSSVVDSEIENILPFVPLIDKNTNYEVVKKLCENINAYFYVEDNILHIKKLNIMSTELTTIHRFKEGHNCKIRNISINEENYDNFFMLEGAGPTPLDKPLASVTRTGKRGIIKKTRYISTDYENVEQLQDAYLDEVIFTEREEVPSLKIEFTYNTKDYFEEVKLGEQISIYSEQTKKLYKEVVANTYNLIVQEITINLTETEKYITIIAGNKDFKIN